MPLYELECSNCGYQEERLCLLSAHSILKVGVTCPSCGESTLVLTIPRVANVVTGTQRERLKMKDRFTKRNKRLEAMPRPQQERMKGFMRKHGVKRTSNG